MTNHPESAAEAEHLRDTLAVLEARIHEIGTWKVQGFQTLDTVALQRALVRIHQALVSARPSVYFGRLDYLGESGQPETHYLGKVGVEQAGRIVVVDWRAPVARLFSRRRPGPAEFANPDGLARVNLQLKRHLVVAGDALTSLFDEYDARPRAPGEAAAAEVDPDAYLREVLAGRHGAAMADMVATLQEHQDDLIRAEPRQALVVQGVAGSGKTSIALHRVAFLLYPENRTGIESERCIIFGPNALFLGYIAQVLPGLGVLDIPQTTLDAWALEQLGLAGREVRDATLAALLDPRLPEPQRQQRVARARLKGSLRMGRLLANYAEWLRSRLAVPLAGLAYGDTGPLRVRVSLGQARLIDLHHSLRELPLLRHRERFVELALGELMGQYAGAMDRELAGMAEEAERLRARQAQLLADAARLASLAEVARQSGDPDLEAAGTAESLETGARGLRELAEVVGRQGGLLAARAERLAEEAGSGQRRPEVRAAVQRRLEADLAEAWPAPEPVAAYRALLGDARLLARLGRGVFTADELALLHSSEWPKGEAVDASDLPALAYLHQVLNGVAVPVFDHVVIDEAQDAAPLYLATLKPLSRNQSFTLLGDLAQGVHGYRGLADWDEARQALAGGPYQFADVRESYRSTVEIMQFANRLQELITPPGQPVRLAQPFNRHGPPVGVHIVASAEALGPALAERIVALAQAGHHNQAVIARTPEHAAEVAQALAAAGVAGAQLATAAGESYPGGLVVLPVHLAKGLEFDAVLVAGADDRHYSGSEFDGRLLYVAATRALHALEFVCVGAANVFVELAR